MIHAITTLASGVELLTDLTAAAVLLMVLDKVAVAVRWTYAAGRYTGRLWFAYGLPAFLMAADGISWLNAQIDWAFVAGTVVDCLKVIAAALFTVVTLLWDARRRYLAANTITPVTVAPVIRPLAMVATDLQQLTCSEIRRTYGLRQKTSKARLIGAALAC